MSSSPVKKHDRDHLTREIKARRKNRDEEKLHEQPLQPAVTRVNAVLKANGREERLVRGRGYYYLRNTHLSSMLCVMWLDPTE